MTSHTHLPSDRSSYKYAPLYCEENIWHLNQHERFADRTRAVLFISNPGRTCALWHQRGSDRDDGLVVWDYHVILVVKSEDGSEWEIWDFDSTIPFPSSFEAWRSFSFPFEGQVDEAFEPLFRVVRPEVYTQLFVSDRSHMRTTDGSWTSPPPPWDCIGVDEHVKTNLRDFMDTKNPSLGVVCPLIDLERVLSEQLEQGARGVHMS